LAADTSELYGAGYDLSMSYDGDKQEWNSPPSIGAFEYGTSSFVPCTSITVTGTGSATTITVDDGTLQMLAAFSL